MRTLSCTVMFLLFAGAAAFAAERSVQVREAQVRENPSFLGKIVGVLEYGDRVELLEERSGWSRINAPGENVSGWLHTSALSEERIVLEAGEEDVETGASQTEVALAGRGFNEEVENRYAGEQNLNYAWVDRMEKEYDYDPEELLSFLEEGDLGAKTEGRASKGSAGKGGAK